MKKRMWLAIPVVAVVFSLSAVILPAVVYANDSEDSSETGGEDNSGSSSDAGTTEKTKEQLKKLAEQRKEAEKKRQENLKREREELRKKGEAEKKRAAEAKEKFKAACENRRENFKKRMEYMSERAAKHGATLDNIVQRVEAFKSTHSLAVENYDALLADVKTKQAVVDDIAAIAKQQAGTFSCGDEQGEAKANVATFKDVLTQEIDALKAYKTSVKNLVKAVKTAAEAEGAGNGQN